MTRLQFAVSDIVVVPNAAVPQLTAVVRIEDSGGSPPITAVALRCQVLVEGGRVDDDPPAVGALPWMQCGLLIPGFGDGTEIEMPLPVTYDFDVRASNYLHALRDAEVPLLFLFSGTILTRGRRGHDVEQIPSDSEARFSMPVAVWRRLVETYYPDSGWVRLDHDTMTALTRVKESGGHASFDETVWALLVTRGDTDSGHTRATPGAR